MKHNIDQMTTMAVYVENSQTFKVKVRIKNSGVKIIKKMFSVKVTNTASANAIIFLAKLDNKYHSNCDKMLVDNLLLLNIFLVTSTENSFLFPM